MPPTVCVCWPHRLFLQHGHRLWHRLRILSRPLSSVPKHGAARGYVKRAGAEVGGACTGRVWGFTWGLTRSVARATVAQLAELLELSVMVMIWMTRMTLMACSMATTMTTTMTRMTMGILAVARSTLHSDASPTAGVDVDASCGAPLIRPHAPSQSGTILRRCTAHPIRIECECGPPNTACSMKPLPCWPRHLPACGVSQGHTSRSRCQPRLCAVPPLRCLVIQPQCPRHQSESLQGHERRLRPCAADHCSYRALTRPLPCSSALPLLTGWT